MNAVEKGEAMNLLKNIYAAAQQEAVLPLAALKEASIEAFGQKVRTVVPYGWVYDLYTQFATMAAFKAAMTARYGNFSVFVVGWMIEGGEQVPLHIIVLHPPTEVENCCMM